MAYRFFTIIVLLISCSSEEYKIKKWPSRVIPYKLNCPEGEEREKIQSYILKFRNSTNIIFVDCNKPGNDCNDEGILGIYYNDKYPYSKSTVGYSIINRVQLCIISEADTMHELMHALGFIHEQNRIDRDLYIDILWENIIPEEKDDFAVEQNAAIDYTKYTYDPNSVMQYADDTSSKNGEKTMILKSGEKIGQGGHTLSKEDIFKINSEYPEN